ncbi:MAG: FAD/NAD(P)-binding protein [Rhodobacter sp.]|nr:FAD/NAD(P)-binding protein [Rhodobacter sp.]
MDAANAQDPMVPHRYRVAEVWEELDDVTTMSLLPVDGPPRPFKAGQFNMLYAYGVGEAAISISGDPAVPERLIHTTRNVGRVSAALTRLRAGDMLGVRGPFGSDWPVEDQKGRHMLFVAGGLGLAPLRGAVCQALANRLEYEEVSLLFGARSPDDLLYRSQVAEWGAFSGANVEVTVDMAARGWTGHVGVVTTRLERILGTSDPANVSVFICGPEIMMRFTAQDLTELGVPASRIWVSMERNMKCALGFCGHCQWGPDFVCKDGPVFRYDQIGKRLAIREI